MTRPEHVQPTEDFEPTQTAGRRPQGEDRPDWLAGVEDDLRLPTEAEAHLRIPPVGSARHARAAEPGPAPEPSPPSDQDARRSDPPNEDDPDATPRSWSKPPNSMPRLTITPRRERPVPPDAAPGPTAPTDEEDGEAAASVAETPAPPAPPEELSGAAWIERLATRRTLQAGILVAIGIVCVAVFWRPGGEPLTSVASIKLHPERYENLVVRVRGEVVESFQVGRGFVFQLRQGEDTVVVYSPTRHPARHDKVVVDGTVSTGYLDGQPRVALFESPQPAPTH